MDYLFTVTPPRDCYDLLESGHKNSGVYVVYPIGYKRGIKVYCDMETSGGGWLVGIHILYVNTF